MDTARTGFFLTSPAKLTALIAILVLFVAAGWSIHTRPNMVASTTATTSSEIQNTDIAPFSSTASASTSPITPLGASILAQTVLAYDNATKDGASPEAGVAAVKELAGNINPTLDFRTYAASDIKTDTDTSKERVLNYRADLRTALEPLLNNKDFELDIYANYVDTKDAKYLAALHAAADNYRLAIANTEKVVAPSDAASYHATVLSAMSRFAASLDALADSASDPFASAALLKSYLGAQDSMVASFNLMSKYAKDKTL